MSGRQFLQFFHTYVVISKSKSKCSFGQNRGQKCVFHVFLHSVVMFCSDWNCLIFCCLLLRKRDLQRVKDTCHETLNFFFPFFLRCVHDALYENAIQEMFIWEVPNEYCIQKTFQVMTSQNDMWSKVSHPFHSAVCPSAAKLFQSQHIFMDFISKELVNWLCEVHRAKLLLLLRLCEFISHIPNS